MTALAGTGIRTFGSRTRHQAVRPRRGRFPVIGSSPHWPGGTGISNLRPLAGWISALERGRFQGHKQKRKLKSVAPFARNRKFESISLQRRVCELSVPRRRTLVLFLGWSAIAQIPSPAEPMVRILFPPAESQVRTCLSREFAFLRREAAVSAGVRAGASGAVGRDARGAATSCLRAVISLSGYIPVPHRR
jgi:hypothetical protein